MTSRTQAISLGLQVLASDPAVRDIYFRGVLLRNVVLTQDYVDLEALRAEGEVRALQSAIVGLLAARDLEVDDAFRAALAGQKNVETLNALLVRAATATSTAEILAPNE